MEKGVDMQQLMCGLDTNTKVRSMDNKSVWSGKKVEKKGASGNHKASVFQDAFKEEKTSLQVSHKEDDRNKLHMKSKYY